jgi:GDPmannose 4,6-dehydratase
MSKKRALICGVSGQDGAWLAKLLLAKDYRVFGSSRDAQVSSFGNLKQLSLYDQIEYVSMAHNDFRSVLQALVKLEPDEVYNLAGQSSVGLSFQQPVETLESIATGTLNLLEAIRFIDKPIRFYNAGSSECFGNTGEHGAANEETPFRPRSPYAVAKAAAHWEVANYREAYGLYACSGILFNHESELRPARFVTKKIVGSAVRISKGSNEKLELGNIQVWRDWGYAPEYVEGMRLMLQRDEPEDFVLATGTSHSLEEFVSGIFAILGMDWKEHVRIEDSFFRPSDISYSRGNPEKAWEKLNWEANTQFPELLNKLIAAEIDRISR